MVFVELKTDFMDKQKILQLLLTKLNKDRLLLFTKYQEHQNASLEAPTAAQSWSDTSRFEFGGLADNVLRQLKNLDELIACLKQERIVQNDEIYSGSIAQIEENKKGKKSKLYFYFVPEGAGGQELEIGNIRLYTVSIDSPLGRRFLFKKAGAEIMPVVGEERLKILNID